MPSRFREPIVSAGQSVAGGDHVPPHLFGRDATRIVALGPSLAGSFAGRMPATPECLIPPAPPFNALAGGWRDEPELTRQIVATAAASASQPARDQLARVRSAELTELSTALLDEDDEWPGPEVDVRHEMRTMRV